MVLRARLLYHSFGAMPLVEMVHFVNLFGTHEAAWHNIRNAIPVGAPSQQTLYCFSSPGSPWTRAKSIPQPEKPAISRPAPYPLCIPTYPLSAHRLRFSERLCKSASHLAHVDPHFGNFRWERESETLWVLVTCLKSSEILALLMVAHSSRTAIIRQIFVPTQHSNDAHMFCIEIASKNKKNPSFEYPPTPKKRTTSHGLIVWRLPGDQVPHGIRDLEATLRTFDR